MSTTTITRDETAILAVLQEHADAIGAADAERMIAAFDRAAVRYDLSPPLVQTNGTLEEDAADLRAWFATFDGPIRVAHRDPTVVADGDVAFVHSLTSMTATPAGREEPFTLWFRSTYGLRRVAGSWTVVHQHESVPFLMDGSFTAAVELTPEG
jgi:ketosteroid isomerase-like protein